MRKFQHISFIAFLFAISSCKKNPAVVDPPPVDPINVNQRLSYGDSIFYIKSQSYTISPVNPRPGTYSAFPDNLLIDNATGKITVTITGKGQESQTGLRYKIMFQAAGSSEKDSTYILLAGINYLDKIYYLSQNDSIISPVYNGNLSGSLPPGTYGIQPDSKLAINPVNGQINIKETIRRGFFDTPAENGEWEEVSILYQSDDNSNRITNRIDIALYFYNRLSDVPSNISTVMRAHQTMVLGVPQTQVPVTFGPIDNDLPDNLSISRPRPPCIIIVAN